MFLEERQCQKSELGIARPHRLAKAQVLGLVPAAVVKAVAVDINRSSLSFRSRSRRKNQTPRSEFSCKTWLWQQPSNGSQMAAARLPESNRERQKPKTTLAMMFFWISSEPP